jgi:PncC family amidohydrolase
MITDIPGSSDYFRGGMVSYDDDIKVRVLGVKQETLEHYGAVSLPTAIEMARGVRQLMNTSIGLSDTGIAGPGGESPEKPIGLFYLGISTPEGTHAEKRLFRGNRQENKLEAATVALQMLYNYLEGW